MSDNKSSKELFEKSKSFFDKRFSTCNFAEKKCYLKKYDFVLSCMDIRSDDMLADIGCAQGGLLLLCKKKKIKALGVDFSHEALKVAKRFGLENVVCGDVQKLPLQNNIFDKIVVLQTLEVLPNKTSALNEIRRIAKKDAEFYFEFRNSSFVLRRLSDFLAKIFKINAKSIKPELLFLKDPSYDQWAEMLCSCGYDILRSVKAPVYMYYENPVQLIKTFIIKMVYWLFPTKYCFTVAFLCKNVK